MATKKPQVTGYPVQEVRDELERMASSKRGMSVSLLVQEALDIALPELRKRYGVFVEPAQETPGRKKRRAA